MADSLRENGWWVGDNTFTGDLVDQLRDELDELIAHERLHTAGIGRERDFQIDPRVRRDQVFWLSRQRQVQRMFLDRMENLRLKLNRELFLGLFEFEGHFAHYPPGAYYRRHSDSFRGAANRIVSVAIYLTDNWQPGDGGELVLYEEQSDAVLARIEPRSGNMVLLLSEEIPHEVLPAMKDRTSITGWFRLNNSIGGIVDPAR